MSLPFPRWHTSVSTAGFCKKIYFLRCFSRQRFYWDELPSAVFVIQRKGKAAQDERSFSYKRPCRNIAFPFTSEAELHAYFVISSRSGVPCAVRVIARAYIRVKLVEYIIQAAVNRDGIIHAVIRREIPYPEIRIIFHDRIGFGTISAHNASAGKGSVQFFGIIIHVDINRTLWQASVVVGVFCCTQRVDVEVCIPDARAPVLIKFLSRVTLKPMEFIFPVLAYLEAAKS